MIFGGAGDLASRKLLPALYNLAIDGLLPPATAIVGAGRKAFDDNAYRAFAREGVARFSRRRLDEEQWAWLQADLAALDPKTPVLLFSHIPIFSMVTVFNQQADKGPREHMVITLVGKAEVVSPMASRRLAAIASRSSGSLTVGTLDI